MILFEYDIITSYMENFSVLKCTAIAELFYVIIYTKVFTIWFKKSQNKWQYLCIF